MEKTYLNKLINTILILSLLLSGMCFSDYQTDSRFTCNTATNESNFSHTDKLSSSEELCTIELLNNINNIYVRSEKKSASYNFQYNTFANLTETLSDILYSSSIISWNEQSAQPIISNKIIINYIHHKDGSKS